MGKTLQICIRVTPQQKEIIEKYYGSYSKIFEIGFEKWAETIPEICDQCFKKYKNLYIHWDTKRKDCIDMYIQNNGGLRELIKQYIESGRSIDNPSSQDKFWIKAKLSKTPGTTYEEFMMELKTYGGSL